jgi:hypothetical protein
MESDTFHFPDTHHFRCLETWVSSLFGFIEQGKRGEALGVANITVVDALLPEKITVERYGTGGVTYQPPDALISHAMQFLRRGIRDSATPGRRRQYYGVTVGFSQNLHGYRVKKNASFYPLFLFFICLCSNMGSEPSARVK